MTHYICKGGCGGVSNEAGVCQAESCPNHFELLEECDCADGKHGGSEFGASDGADEEVMVVKDSNGTPLKDGDDVVLIKDLTLSGSSTTFKRGTKVGGIRLTGNAAEVDCKLGGSAIVLRTEFLKKGVSRAGL